MGRLSDRISKLQDYPGNKSPLAPSTTRRSSEQLGVDQNRQSVANKIASITPDEIMHSMDSSDLVGDALGGVSPQNLENQSTDTVVVGSGNPRKSSRSSFLGDSDDSDLPLSKDLLLSVGVRKPMMNLPLSVTDSGEMTPIKSEAGKTEEVQSTLFDFGLNAEPDQVKEVVNSIPTFQQPPQHMDFFGTTMVSPETNVSKEPTQGEIINFYSSKATALENTEHITNITNEGDVTIMKMVDEDVMAMEVKILDTTGRISDIIDKYQERSGQLIIPIEMTRVPELVVPARHDVARICNKLYFMPNTTDILARTEKFLRECEEDLSSGKRIEQELMEGFNYDGVNYFSPKFTTREITYIVSTLRKYEADIRQYQNSLKLVAGDYYK